MVTLHDESPNTLVRCKRFAHALLHLVRGMATTLIVYPFCNQAQRAAHVREWCAQLLHILSVRMHVKGTPPGGSAVPMMIVANHVSWLDILAINAVRTVRFVGKAEIRRWPALGWLCANNGTLFIERERRHHPARINALVVSAMAQRRHLCSVPRGTNHKWRPAAALSCVTARTSNCLPSDTMAGCFALYARGWQPMQ